MANNIPFYLAQIGDLNARSIGGERRMPEVGNRQLGPALENVSHSLNHALGALDQFTYMQRRNNIASITAASSFTPKFLQMKQNMPVDGSGFVDDVSAQYDDYSAGITNNIEDPIVRREVGNNLARRKRGYLEDAATSAFGAQQQNAKTVANEGLTSALNDVSARPTPEQLNVSLENGYGVIDAQPFPQAHKDAMKLQFRQKAYYNQADAMLNVAESTNDIDNFQRYLSRDDVKQSMDAGAYDRMQRSAYAKGRMFARQDNVGLTSQIHAMRQVALDGGDIPEDTMRDMKMWAQRARNPYAQQLLAEVDDIGQTNRTYRGSSIADIQAARYNNLHPSENEGKFPVFSTGLDKQVTQGINRAAAVTGASPTFLAGTVNNEYGGILKTGDYSRGAANGGSAVGLTQMQDGSWLDMIKSHPDQFAAEMDKPITGKELLAKSDAELLELRKNPKLNLIGAGYYASANKDAYTRTFGGSPSDGDLYVMHVLGTTGGLKLIAAKNNAPDTDVSAVVSKGAIDGNKPFFEKNGVKLSCVDAYNCMTAGLSMSNYRVNASRTQVLDRILRQDTRAYNTDSAQFALDKGAQGMEAITSDSTASDWAQRGAAIQSFAAMQGNVGYNDKPLAPPKPLTNAEANSIASRLQDPDVNVSDKIAVLGNIYKLGSKQLTNTALAQIGEKDPLSVFAAQTASRGDTQTAYNIFMGRNMLAKNAVLPTALGITDQNISQEYYSGRNGVGSALSLLPPSSSGVATDTSVIQAAKMVYIYKAHGLGHQTDKATGSMDRKLWRESINQVLGAAPGHDAVQTYNGAKTLMPYGVDSSDINHFMRNVTPENLSRISSNGGLPSVIDARSGEMVTVPMHALRNAVLKASGGGYYTLIGTDGGALMSNLKGPNGRYRPYMIKLTDGTMHQNESGWRLPIAANSPYTGPRAVSNNSNTGGLPLAKEE